MSAKLGHVEAKGLQEKRNELTTRMVKLVEEAGEDGLTAERQEEFDKLDSQQEKYLKLMGMAARANSAVDEAIPEIATSDAAIVEKLTREEAQAEDFAMAQRMIPQPDGLPSDFLDSKEHGQCLRGWMCGDRANGELRNVCERAGWDYRSNVLELPWHTRRDYAGYPVGLGTGTYTEIREHYAKRFETRQQAGGPGSDPGAGYETVPDEMMKPLEEAIKTIGQLREVSNVITTATGAPLPWPSLDDTGVKALIIAENSPVTQQDMTFAQIVYGAYKYATLVLASVEFLQDTSINANEVIGRNLGIRIARGTNEHFTTGTGTAQPYGFLTDSVLGKTTAANTGFTYDELLDLKHSLDPAYAEAPSTRWMMNYKTLGVMKQMVTPAGYVVWQPSMVPDAPDRFDGTAIAINQDMPDIGASATPIACGDFSKFIIRETLGVQLMRLVERYADNLQVGFLAYSRHDSRLLDAGTNPIKHIAMPA